MSKQKKIMLVLLGLLLVVLAIAFFRFNSSSDLDEQSKEKPSDSESALEQKNRDNGAEKERKDDGQQKAEEKAKQEEKKADKSEGALTPPKKKEENKNVQIQQNSDAEAKKASKPSEQDLKNKATKFAQIMAKSKDPRTIKSDRQQMSDIATKELTNKVFGGQLQGDDQQHEARNVDVKIDKKSMNEKKPVATVTYDIYGKPSESDSDKKVMLREDIRFQYNYKYEDGKWLISNFRM